MKNAAIVTQFFEWMEAIGKPQPLADREDFARFYQATHLQVYRYLHGLWSGPVEDVDDLAAETFLKAWKGRHSYRGEAEEAIYWVLKIGRRLLIDAWRRQQVRQTTSMDGMDETIDLQLLPDQRFLQDQNRSLLTEQIVNLPPDVREMIVLRYGLGWRVNQIAAYLGIPENTVSVTMRRGLSRLQRAMLASEEEQA